jgi:hypothetical protein
MNPYELAKMQFGVAVGMNRFLHPPSAKQVSAEKALDDKRGSWQDYWSSADAAPKHQYSSLAFPRKN